MAKPRARGNARPLRPPARITRRWSWPQQLGDRVPTATTTPPRQRPRQCRHREFGDGNTVTVIGGNSSATAQLGDGNTATTTVIGGGSALASLGDGNTVIVRGDGLFAHTPGNGNTVVVRAPRGSTIMPGASARRAGATGAESQKPGVAGLGGPTSISTARRRLSRITRCLPGPVCRERPEVGDLQAHLAVARSAGVGAGRPRRPGRPPSGWHTARPTARAPTWCPTRSATRTRPLSHPRYWRDTVTAAGIRHIKLHAGRHTCATLMHLQGFPVAVIAAWIGHKDASVTMRLYAHSQDDALRMAGDTLNRVVTSRDTEARYRTVRTAERAALV